MKRLVRSFKVVVGAAFQADRKYAAAAFVGQPVSWLGSAFQAYFLKLLTDGAFRGDERAALLGAFGITASIGVVYLLGTSTAKMNSILRDKTAFSIDRRLMSLSSDLPGLEHHERPDYQDQMELLREGRGQLSAAVSNILYAFSVLGQSIVFAVLLASLHPLLLLLPLFGIPSLFAGTASTRLFKKIDEENADKVRLARHLFNLTTTPASGKEVRIFGLAQEFIARHERLWTEVRRVRTRGGIKTAAWTVLGSAFFGFGFASALAFVAWRAMRGQATPGDVVLAIFLGSQVNNAVSNAVQQLNGLYRQLTLAERYLWLLDYAEQAQGVIASRASERKPPPTTLAKGIFLENLSFSYPDTDAEVLHDVSVLLPAGSTVALVGENGAGKTTLVKLLLGFYEPSSGRILVDGQDLTYFDPAEWRSFCAAGFQDFCRFELLLRETVGIGDLPFIDEAPAVISALHRAGADDVPATLAQGLETQLGPTFGGIDLSVGQWQKLALGRSMMRKQPLLLILDEPTASLDAPTEHALFERYAHATNREGARGAITVLVSHRFSTVRMADLIIVIDEGRIVELGNHSELVASGHLYAELFDLQARGYR